jgi:hypothetical protein
MRFIGRCVVVGVIVIASLAPSTPALADRPNTPAQVTHDSSLDKTLSGRIGSSTDKDWYRFELRRPGRYMVRLTSLPANLRLDVFDAHRNVVDRSARPWRQFEEVYRHFGAHTYYVRVASQDGTYSAHRGYHLRFSYLAPGLRTLSKSHWGLGYGNVRFACDMVNNTAHWQIVLNVRFELVDSSGTVYDDGDSDTSPDVVRPHQHTTCDAEFERRELRRLDHVRLIPEYERTPWRDFPISILPGRISEDSTYGTVVHGQLRNRGATRIHEPFVDLTFYGPSGRVRDEGFDFGGKRWLPPGATTKYRVSTHRIGPHAFVGAYADASDTPPRV